MWQNVFQSVKICQNVWQNIFRVLKFVMMCDIIFARTYDRCLNLIVVAKQPPAFKIAASHLLWELNHDRGNFDPVFALRLRKGPFASLSRVNEPAAACLSFRRVFQIHVHTISEPSPKLKVKCQHGKIIEYWIFWAPNVAFAKHLRVNEPAKNLREILTKYLDWAHFVQTQPKNSPLKSWRFWRVDLANN